MADHPACEAAHAKINLFLHVTGRRDDGYHLLDSLVVFAGAADRLTVAADPGLRLSVGGSFGSVLRKESGENLVLRAARLLAGDIVPGAHLVLEKRLPVASGIGGGSADAAASLRLLRRFWKLPAASATSLHALAAALGADVPVCLASRPARMQGIGETLCRAPRLPRSLGMALIHCGEAIPTPAVFRARAEMQGVRFSAAAALPDGWDDVASLALSLSLLSNDLEPAARSLCPGIDPVLTRLGALPGCRLARMSGSGATCFGLFDSPEAARGAVAAERWPERWWVWAGDLYRPESTGPEDPV